MCVRGVYVVRTTFSILFCYLVFYSISRGIHKLIKHYVIKSRWRRSKKSWYSCGMASDPKRNKENTERTRKIWIFPYFLCDFIVECIFHCCLLWLLMLCIHLLLCFWLYLLVRDLFGPQPCVTSAVCIFGRFGLSFTSSILSPYFSHNVFSFFIKRRGTWPIQRLLGGKLKQRSHKWAAKFLKGVCSSIFWKMACTQGCSILGTFLIP